MDDTVAVVENGVTGVIRLKNCLGRLKFSLVEGNALYRDAASRLSGGDLAGAKSVMVDAVRQSGQWANDIASEIEDAWKQVHPLLDATLPAVRELRPAGQQGLNELAEGLMATEQGLQASRTEFNQTIYALGQLRKVIPEAALAFDSAE